jgi:hypothetical protein
VHVEQCRKHSSSQRIHLNFVNRLKVQSGSNALDAINCPTIVSWDWGASAFVATATLTKTLTISCLQMRVMRPL